VEKVIVSIFGRFSLSQSWPNIKQGEEAFQLESTTPKGQSESNIMKHDSIYAPPTSVCASNTFIRLSFQTYPLAIFRQIDFGRN